MKKIIICGDCGSRKLTKAIIKACTKTGGAFVCDGARIYETGKNAEYLVVSTCTLTDISCESGIIVFGKALCQVHPDIDIGNMIPVIDTENTDARKLLHKSGKAVVGCSMSGRDTISVSGIMSFPSKLISLQRSVRGTDGEIIEPHEFSVKMSEEMPIFPMLAACSVLLLSGNNSERGYYI